MTWEPRDYIMELFVNGAIRCPNLVEVLKINFEEESLLSYSFTVARSSY